MNIRWRIESASKRMLVSQRLLLDFFVVRCAKLIHIDLRAALERTWHGASKSGHRWIDIVRSSGLRELSLSWTVSEGVANMSF